MPWRWVCRRQPLSTKARTAVVRNRTGGTTDASRDDRCPRFGIEPRLWAWSMITVRATPIERLFDGVGFGFGKQTLRCRIAP